MRPAIVPIWLVPCVALLWACSGNDEPAEGSAPTSARPAMETGPDAREAIRLALEHPDRLVTAPDRAFLKGVRVPRADRQRDFADAILLDISGSMVQRGTRAARRFRTGYDAEGFDF